MKWKVMRAFGMLPSDARTRQMNVFQWLWCYHNIIEDEKEEQEVAKMHFDRLGFIANPEVAKSVFEAEQRLINKNKGKVDSRPIGSTDFRADEAIHQSDAFEIEAKAAAKGYDPNMDITPLEFLQQLENKEKQVDIFNDSFDELLASGQFHEVPDTSNGAGDPFETFDDFFTKAMQFKVESDQELDQLENVKEYKNKETEEELKDVLQKYGLTEDDLDIFITDEDE